MRFQRPLFISLNALALPLLVSEGGSSNSTSNVIVGSLLKVPEISRYASPLQSEFSFLAVCCLVLGYHSIALKVMVGKMH
uniref:Secreted protein n=1 Tax=Panstrongylus lignarius TaxID=156445 RepID=A0A224Y4Z6_9HEMI